MGPRNRRSRLCQDTSSRSATRPWTRSPARTSPSWRASWETFLFEIVFLAQLGRERGDFDFASVARRIHDKMVARHPHVFGEAHVHDAEGVRVQWEELKRKEREKEGRPPSPFDGVPRALPALLKAVRLTSRAADLGFDWERDADVLAKLDEEVAEFKAELEAPAGADAEVHKARVAGEIGDLLFTVVNVARRHGVDPEAALQGTNDKFRRRFEEVARRGYGRKERQGHPLAGWTPCGTRSRKKKIS